MVGSKLIKIVGTVFTVPEYVYGGVPPFAPKVSTPPPVVPVQSNVKSSTTLTSLQLTASLGMVQVTLLKFIISQRNRALYCLRQRLDKLHFRLYQKSLWELFGDSEIRQVKC